jgi:hypothetical protein
LTPSSFASSVITPAMKSSMVGAGDLVGTFGSRMELVGNSVGR